jgi:hypothetical protein
MTPHDPESDRILLDFGRGSREQTQGGPSKDNVHPIRKLAEAVAPRG